MKRNSTTAKRASDDSRKIVASDFKRARFRVGGKDVDRKRWQAAVRSALGKQRITIMVDADVLAAFKAQAGARGYQTLINQTLRRSLEQESLERTLRQVVREELAAHS